MPKTEFNRWEKLEVASKVIAAVFIPAAVAFFGNQVASANKQRETESKFVELAIAILNKDPSTNQSEENRNLRQWAVDVINRFSGVSMNAATATALVQKTSLPQTKAAQSTGAYETAGPWAVVFGADKTLDGAKDEVIKTAEKMGIAPAEIFYRNGVYRSVRVFTSRSEAEDTLGKARVVRSSSYLVNLSTWCPIKETRSGYSECVAP